MSGVPILDNQVLHNSIDERKFIRVTLPAKFKIITDTDEEVSWCTLDEMSLGGFSFQAEKGPSKIKVGLNAQAWFEFELGPATIRLELSICIVKNTANRLSGTFYDLTGEKRETLRYIIGAYLSGEPCLFWPFIDTHSRLL